MLSDSALKLIELREEPMLKTNIDDLVMMGVTAFVSPPTLLRSPYRPDTEGVGQILIGMAGVVYNARVGDPAYGWAGDHVEPGVSIAHPDYDIDHALHYLGCIGNEVVVISGLAAGARGRRSTPGQNLRAWDVSPELPRGNGEKGGAQPD
jgi:hypothetical protein